LTIEAELGIWIVWIPAYAGMTKFEKLSKKLAALHSHGFDFNSPAAAPVMI
jgi:hypothetical protein